MAKRKNYFRYYPAVKPWDKMQWDIDRILVFQEYLLDLNCNFEKENKEKTGIQWLLIKNISISVSGYYNGGLKSGFYFDTVITKTRESITYRKVEYWNAHSDTKISFDNKIEIVTDLKEQKFEEEDLIKFIAENLLLSGFSIEKLVKSYWNTTLENILLKLNNQAKEEYIQEYNKITEKSGQVVINMLTEQFSSLIDYYTQPSVSRVTELIDEVKKRWFISDAQNEKLRELTESINKSVITHVEKILWL